MLLQAWPMTELKTVFCQRWGREDSSARLSPCWCDAVDIKVGWCCQVLTCQYMFFQWYSRHKAAEPQPCCEVQWYVIFPLLWCVGEGSAQRSAATSLINKACVSHSIKESHNLRGFNEACRTPQGRPAVLSSQAIFQLSAQKLAAQGQGHRGDAPPGHTQQQSQQSRHTALSSGVEAPQAESKAGAKATGQAETAHAAESTQEVGPN